PAVVRDVNGEYRQGAGAHAEVFCRALRNILAVFRALRVSTSSCDSYRRRPMTQLYPFLMSPAFDPRPWGTLDLALIYPNAKFNEKIGEAWLTGDNCVVTNGPFARRTLAELSKELGTELVGTAARDPRRFPL